MKLKKILRIVMLPVLLPMWVAFATFMFVIVPLMIIAGPLVWLLRDDMRAIDILVDPFKVWYDVAVEFPLDGIKR